MHTLNSCSTYNPPVLRVKPIRPQYDFLGVDPLSSVRESEQYGGTLEMRLLREDHEQPSWTPPVRTLDAVMVHVLQSQTATIHTGIWNTPILAPLSIAFAKTLNLGGST